MWVAYWGMIRAPFEEAGGPYVPLPGHDEAVARLLYTIESSDRLALLIASAGMGKTRVLEQALAQARHPLRRIVLVKDPLDADDLVGRLAEKLGTRSRPVGGRGTSWRALERGLQACRLQRFSTVLAVEGSRGLASPDGGDCLVRLMKLGGADPELGGTDRGMGRTNRGGVTVVLSGDADAWEGVPELRCWTLSIALKPLTVSDVGLYLATRLGAAGCRDRLFTPQAICRLQLLAAGNPRGLNRLATLSLMAGASRGAEAVSSELVDSVATECRFPSMAALHD